MQHKNQIEDIVTVTGVLIDKELSQMPDDIKSIPLR